MSDHHYPPYPCCGGIVFHAGGAKCDAYRKPAPPPFWPTRSRFAWRVETPDRENPPEGYELADRIPWRDATASQHGECFRNARVTYGLTLREVARGWSLPDTEVGELERGLRRFRSPADLHAALQQLWCWANEKFPEISR